MTQILPPKKDVALALLERSNVDIHLDPRARGVVVPPQFRKEPRLILKIGLNMPVPIPDLRVDEESLSCTLSFNRSPFFCVLPWASVFAIVGEDGRGMVWPDDVPQELAVKVDPDRVGPPATAGGGRRAPRGSKLAEAPPPREAATTTRGRSASKKKTSKKEVTRPTLVAVPSGDAKPASERQGATITRLPFAKRPEEPAAEAPPPAPAPAPARSTGPRPKRELPPYLRVVK
jgi:stringent starvation protein B